MKFVAWKLGFKIQEVPITFQDRKTGVSKMSAKILKEGMVGVLRLEWQSLFGGFKKKVKAPNTSAKIITANFTADLVAETK
ncbi:MAG: hypothetical protein H7101_11320 [Deinococcales bacterium]|nr:hypothetical protein [Chitinophagaceae bacterium]